jgi:hypothetical protein
MASIDRHWGMFPVKPAVTTAATTEHSFYNDLGFLNYCEAIA